jgi:radical SAM superfamily enzyme YgiQ (UPF0313 family)
MLRSQGVHHVHIGWMIGFPNETLSQINETLNFARELRADSNAFAIVLPCPGTRLFNEAKAANLLVFSEENLDKFDLQGCDFLKSNEWNYDQLQKMIYDANIEMNFLNNPSIENNANRDDILEYFKRTLLKIPGHIVLHLVIGYIYKQKNCYTEYEKHYNIARELFKDKKLSETFSKYLSWDNPIIKDFNLFVSKNPSR